MDRSALALLNILQTLSFFFNLNLISHKIKGISPHVFIYTSLSQALLGIALAENGSKKIGGVDGKHSQALRKIRFMWRSLLVHSITLQFQVENCHVPYGSLLCVCLQVCFGFKKQLQQCLAQTQLNIYTYRHRDPWHVQELQLLL